MNKQAKQGTTLVALIIAIIASYLGMKPEELTTQLVNNTMAIENYYEARGIFWDELYPNGGTTLYCGETFSDHNRDHINIEHVFPMSWVAWSLNCGERKQCRKNSAEFNRIEADLHNLFPSRENINEARRSHPFGNVKGEKRKYGACDFEIDYQKKIVEPRKEIRGDIARAMFYMANRYDLEIREKQYQTLQQWDKQDPVTVEEKARNKKIKSLQGNSNPYIDNQ